MNAPVCTPGGAIVHALTDQQNRTIIAAMAMHSLITGRHGAISELGTVAQIGESSRVIADALLAELACTAPGKLEDKPAQAEHQQLCDCFDCHYKRKHPQCKPAPAERERWFDWCPSQAGVGFVATLRFAPGCSRGYWFYNGNLSDGPHTELAYVIEMVKRGQMVELSPSTGKPLADAGDARGVVEELVRAVNDLLIVCSSYRVQCGCIGVFKCEPCFARATLTRARAYLAGGGAA